MTTGAYIKELRIKKGLTQEELASKTDISVRTIQRIENDDVDPRAYTLQTIAEVLDVTYEMLIELNSEEVAKPQIIDDKFWLILIHLSGLFILLFPPLIIWVIKRNTVKDINKHAVDIMNFQISMLLILIPSSFVMIYLDFIWIVIVPNVAAFIIVMANVLRIIKNQTYKYPRLLKLLK